MEPDISFQVIDVPANSNMSSMSEEATDTNSTESKQLSEPLTMSNVSFHEAATIIIDSNNDDSSDDLRLNR